MPADSASECSSTDQCRRQMTRPTRLRSQRRRQSSPPSRPRPNMRHLAALAAIWAVESTRRVAGCAAVAPGAKGHRCLLSEAAQRARESSGLASQPPQTGQAAVGQLAGLKGTIGTPRPMGPLAPQNLLFYAHAHVVVYTVMLCMVLLNHIFDQAESLKSGNDHWSNRQSSQWT